MTVALINKPLEDDEDSGMIECNCSICERVSISTQRRLPSTVQSEPDQIQDKILTSTRLGRFGCTRKRNKWFSLETKPTLGDISFPIES